jgi:mannose-6-phosphate isomerase-like protein (cupin superfamily)
VYVAAPRFRKLRAWRPRAVPAPRGRRDRVRLNWFELGPGSEGPEHDETASKQEEVMIVLSGGGTLEIDGEELTLSPRRVVRLDPEALRRVRAGGEGITFRLDRLAADRAVRRPRPVLGRRPP